MADVSRLPGPVTEFWEWQHQALCSRMDEASDIFFHPDGERDPARRHRDAQAVAVCRKCPVLTMCRQHALAAREPYGVWGALTEADRRGLDG